MNLLQNYIYAFAGYYPKQLTLYLKLTFTFCHFLLSLGIEPMILLPSTTV